MQEERGLLDVVSLIRERIAAYRGRGIGEQNTKAGLVAPLLRVLGWDVEDLREVHLEYRRRPNDNPVDYALLIQGAPRMFVEAKALDGNLDDQRWANQIMGYAVVAGVRWVVLTNGDEYRLYNSHASVPVEEKLFQQVRISEEATNPEETLALLSKESIAELEALWQENFVDRQVQAALNSLFEPEADDVIIRVLRRRLPDDLSARQVRAALARLRAAPLSQPHIPGQTHGGAGGGRTAPRAHRAGTSAVTLGDIIGAGLLRPPVDLSRRYKGHHLSARIEVDGRVSFEGEVFGSLSVAGAMARRSVIGRPLPTNGWIFWYFRDSDGELKQMDELRRRLSEGRASR